MELQPGDVVLCRFPYREDHTKYSLRPGLVMRVIQQGVQFKVAQITTTDRTGQLPGLLIKAESKEGREMRLKNDSFVNLSNIQSLEHYMIERLIGGCPLMNKIETICREHAIGY